MKVQIIGVGVVGEAQAYLAHHLGHEVLGIDHHRTESPYARMLPTPERNVDLTFICTPEKWVEQVIGELVGQGVQGLYVIKSTVPSGTTRRLGGKHAIHIAHNPEFLREKTAREDIIHPETVVIGACCPAHAELLRAFYAGLGAPIIVSEPTTTETVKLSLNSYLATLITFWNEVDKVAAKLGISTSEVAGIVKLDPRVSSYGTAFFGAPFGGKCLPKDLDQLIEVSRQTGADARMLEAVRDFNKSL